MHIDNVKFLILSKFAYTKFSEKPNFPVFCYVKNNQQIHSSEVLVVYFFVFILFSLVPFRWHIVLIVLTDETHFSILLSITHPVDLI